MFTSSFKFIILVALIEHSFTAVSSAVLNKTRHVRKENEDIFIKSQKLPSYRSYQPVAVKFHQSRVYPKEDRTDYDIASYDTEYGGVVSNFTSSIYDDNPPLYPNPEVISRGNTVITKTTETRVEMSDVDLPDDSLADGDLKEHNIIDSVTYLYGFNTCHGVRTEWLVLIFIAAGISIAMLSCTTMWLMWSDHAKQFREQSKLYPMTINLCCCLEACTLIYVQAVTGVDSPSQCEKIALLLHYSHLTCAMWITLIAISVAEYSASETVMSLKFHYLIAYGASAVVVMFNYALSMEHYEIKHYCWMSIEKGMVMGFMVPAMILIIINTATVIVGLQSVNKKQAEILTAKIQELVDLHFANWPKTEQGDLKGSTGTLDNMFTPGSSRKNTDSSDTLDKENYYSEDDCNYANMGNGNDGSCDEGICENGPPKGVHDKHLLNMLYMDNFSWKSTLACETQQLKSYLTLCLVLEPFFAINWVMGVVAVENAAYWPTPALYLVLLQAMYIYLAATLCTTLPILRENEKQTEPCCEEVVAEPTLTRCRTTDSIPLLDPAIQQPNVTPAPADTISTISI